MAFLNRENILKTLFAFNPWWRTGGIRAEFHRDFRRAAFYEAMSLLTHPDLRRAVILTGVRRVGKTTVQYQAIEELLIQGVDPKRILFVSFDHPLLKLSRFDEILETYHESIHGGEDVFYFFDEIQYASDWDIWLKTVYDNQPKTRILATGSASPTLLGRSAESGAGRWTTVRVPTLDFFEYCHLVGVDERPEIPNGWLPENLKNLSRLEWADLMNRLMPLQKHFQRYLLVGGFPELALSTDEYLSQRILREDVVDKVLKRDLPALYRIRSTTELEKIFLYLCYNSSGIVSTDTIAKEIGGISRPTVEGYIGYLENADLILRSYPVEMSGKRVLKARPKIYIADAALRNAVLMQEDILTDPVEMGLMVETAVYRHVFALYARSSVRVGYFRDPAREKEIDIVVDRPKHRVLIEVKYRDLSRVGEREAIRTEPSEMDTALVVTRREDDFGTQTDDKGTLTRIPAFAFLYLCGSIGKADFKTTSTTDTTL